MTMPNATTVPVPTPLVNRPIRILTRYSDVIVQAAMAAKVPAVLLEAQVVQESGGDPYAVRYEKAYFLRYLKGNVTSKTWVPYAALGALSLGLMQLMVETAYEQGFQGRPESLFDPLVNVQLGARKMRVLWDWAGGTDKDYPKALAAYNEGTGNALAGPPFADQQYVDSIYKIALLT